VNPAIGFPDATGPEGSSEPVAHVLPAWDCIAGNMVVSGLLAAERKRLRTGQGSAVNLALKDVAAAMLGHLGIIGEVEVNGAARSKSGNALYGAYGQDFVCADGRRVMVIGLTDRQWSGLLRVTGTAEAMAVIEAATGDSLREEGARFRHRHAISEILRPWFAAQKVDDFARAFDEAGVTWSVFRDFAGAVGEDPDLSLDNPMFSRLDQPGIGPYRVPGTPFGFSGDPREAPRPAPVLGEHTEAILGDVAGLPDSEIASLFDEGIVQRAPAS
jgi:2-methylfumaryl-CoA isomerase